ncbi:MAG: hypothetical protein ACM31D_10860 [Bacteroidota bacterium]
MRFGLRLGLASAIAAIAFFGGYKLRPKLSPEAIATAYAKYVLHQPRHKQELKDGAIDTVMETDYRAVIGVNSANDVAARRAAMAAYLFRGEPTGMGRLPDQVDRDVSVPLLMNLPLAGIDVLTVTMPWGIDSKVYHLRAAKPRSCLMMYQEGHRVSFLERVRFLERIASEGCDVLALSLPLTGPVNSRPLIDHPRLGRIVLNDPDDLQLLDSQGYSSLAYFVTPLVAALNHALSQQSYDRIGATGFSGGGWAVQVFAALDPRVQVTYSVAGSSPEAVHAAMPEWGSPEQREGRFSEIVNTPELYVMAADRPGRRHLQFFNETDPCCFAGTNWQAWEGAVAERVRQLGGAFRVYSYVNANHTLSKPVGRTIVADFLNLPEGPADEVVTH